MNYVWEQRKFSELYKKVNEKNTFRFGVDKIISVANMYFKEDVKKPNDEYMRTYNIMRLGDIAFEGNKSKNFSHGRFVENTIGDGIVSHVFDVFRPVMDYDLLFWKYLINNENVMGRIMTRCTKASTMMTNLVAKDFLNENILVPTIEEQHKIGTYIDKLEHLITLHHRECIILRKTKVNDWEQRKFGELAEYKKGPFGSAITKSMFVPKSDDSVKVYEQQNAINKDWSLERYFLPKEYAYTRLKAFEVHSGDIIVSCAGTIGEIYEIPDNAEYGVINQALMRVRVNEKIVDKRMFIIAFSNMINEFTRTHSNGSAIKNIPPFADLKPMKVLMPSMEEQRVISEYFEKIDNLITLHQHKCDELQNLKKYMLQNMFV